MRRFLILIVLLFIVPIIFSFPQEKENTYNSKQDWVILLHGIMKTPRSMNKIKKALENEGYKVVNFGYPSTSETIETIAKLLDSLIKNIPEKRKSLNFVTHSLGSIVVRYYLTYYEVKDLGRIVMIAPPNQGSVMAKYLKHWPPYKWFFGKAGQELARSPKSLPNSLPPPPCEFGIIAGGLGNDFGFNLLIPGDDDMTVGVSETKLEGMKDFTLIKGQHTTLLIQRSVIDNVIAFLKTGKFLH